MRDEPFSVEQVELILRTAARGTLPDFGDVLMRTAQGWIFSALNIRSIGSGEFTYPDATIAANDTDSFSISNSRTTEIEIGDFILIAPPGGANDDTIYVVKASDGGFSLYIQNLTGSPADTLTDTSDNVGQFIALRLVV